MLRDKNATYPQIGLLTSLFVCLLTSLFLAAAQFRAEFNTPTPGVPTAGHTRLERHHGRRRGYFYQHPIINLLMRKFFILLLLLPSYLNAQQTAEVKLHLGKPILFVNNQPQLPLFYALTHAYGGRWSWEEVPARNLHNFAQAGVRLFQVDLYLEDIWQSGRDTLDMDKARRQVRGVLAQ